MYMLASFNVILKTTNYVELGCHKKHCLNFLATCDVKPLAINILHFFSQTYS